MNIRQGEQFVAKLCGEFHIWSKTLHMFLQMWWSYCQI